MGHDIDNPFWSPDSEWVYFNGRDDDENAYRVRIKDGHVGTLFSKATIANFPTCTATEFSPSGAVLLSWVDARRNLFALELKIVRSPSASRASPILR